MKTIIGFPFLVLTIGICSATEQSLDAIKQELKSEMKSEMREELRRIQDRMTEACEQRMEPLLLKMSKKVIFSARKTRGGNFDGLITYDTIDVNIGGGMQTNGKFIAPESGTYGFTFSGTTCFEKHWTNVRVFKDGNVHHVIFDGNGADKRNNINGSWMMKLAKGQAVHFNVTDSKLYASSVMPVIFTGNLLHTGWY